jgi:putative ABC transport system ATP-binding protein
VPEPLLAVERVSVSYRSRGIESRALEDLSLSFAPGTLTLVMGPSGSGKTTLLSVLGCLLTPDSGSVFVGGQEVTRLSEAARTRLRRERIGFVFQAFRLFHALTALENVTLIGDIDKSGRRQERARALLDELGLKDKAHLKPNALSGGENQRVAIARVLMRNPDIVLADEPTASLDWHSGRRISETLAEVAEARGRTVVVVSHDPRWQAFAHRVVTLEDGRAMGDTRGGRA